jgi:membrane-bound inhibitor of C-type lysozyme
VCTEEKSFDATFMGSDSVHVQLEERMVVLPHVVSASCAKYSDGDVTAWFKGQENAFVEIAGEMAYADCKR